MNLHHAATTTNDGENEKYDDLKNAYYQCSYKNSLERDDL